MKISICTHQSWDKYQKAFAEMLCVEKKEAEALKEVQCGCSVCSAKLCFCLSASRVTTEPHSHAGRKHCSSATAQHRCRNTFGHSGSSLALRLPQNIAWGSLTGIQNYLWQKTALKPLSHSSEMCAHRPSNSSRHQRVTALNQKLRVALIKVSYAVFQRLWTIH